METKTVDKKDEFLPPRPGETPIKGNVQTGMPFMVYINGTPYEMCKTEALGVMSQILNLLCYQDQREKDNA